MNYSKHLKLLIIILKIPKRKKEDILFKNQNNIL